MSVLCCALSVAMPSLSRACLLVVCLASVLSVALGYDVHWSIYDDQNCTNVVASGSDYNAVFANLGWREAFVSYTCIQLPASISGVRSAHAACGDIDLGSGPDVLDTILQVYTDTNCVTPANITTISSLSRGACSATTSQYWYGPLSARVNCNLPTDVSSSSSSSSGIGSSSGSSSSSSSAVDSGSTSQGGNYATSTGTSAGGISGSTGTSTSTGGNVYSNNTYHTSSTSGTNGDMTSSSPSSSTGSTGTGGNDSKSSAATGGNKIANSTDYASSTGVDTGIGGVIRYNAASRIAAPLSITLVIALLAAIAL